jgi:hypothetical protein
MFIAFGKEKVSKVVIRDAASSSRHGGSPALHTAKSVSIRPAQGITTDTRGATTCVYPLSP